MCVILQLVAFSMIDISILCQQGLCLKIFRKHDISLVGLSAVVSQVIVLNKIDRISSA